MGWLRRLRDTARGSRVDRTLDEEMCFHLESRIDEFVRSGMSDAEARAEARRRFGNVTVMKERARDIDRVRFLSDLIQDLHYGARALLRNPGFSLLAVLTLALGIGANTAIFSVIQALLLRPLPVRDAGELVQLFIVRPDQRPANAFSYPFVHAFASRRDLFNGAFGFAATTFPVGRSDALDQVDGAWVTADYYPTLGLAPVAGRLLRPDDDQPGAAPAVVISDGYWRRRFAASPNVVGQTLLIYETPVTIVGVSGRGFTGTTVGRTADLTIALGAAPQLRPEMSNLLQTGANMLSVMARLRQGVSAKEARSRLDAGWRQIVTAVPNAAALPDNFLSARLTVEAGGRGWSTLREQFGRPLLALLSMVGLILLIACVNVANLLLARTAARAREIATRLAIGASRGRIVRQLLTESALLGMTGAALGLLSAWFVSQELVAHFAKDAAAGLGPSPGPASPGGLVALDVMPDFSVVMFTSLVCIGTVALFGTAPALRATRRAPGVVRPSSIAGRGRIEALSVTAQLSLSMLLLVCSGLFVRTLQNLRDFDRGFAAEDVLLVDVDGRAAGYSGAVLAERYRDVLESIDRLPGVRAASYSLRTPLAKGESSYEIFLNGRRVHEEALYYPIGPRYFATMRTPMVTGREFTNSDTAMGHKVAVVNEAFAKKHVQGLNPIGQQLALSDGGPLIEIVGVVKDALFTGNARYLAAPPSLYVPYAQSAPSRATFVVALSGTSSDVSGILRGEVSRRLPNARIETRTMAEQLDRGLLQERLLASVGSAFGAMALALAAVGLYGLLAYNVTRRTNEIGIRSALGAKPFDILRLIVGRAARVLAVGLFSGILLAGIASSILKRMLFGVTAADPLTLSVAVATLVVTGVMAVVIPARRALRIDPLVALRSE